MIRRPPRSTRVRSSAASDVYKRQVSGLKGATAYRMVRVVPLLGYPAIWLQNGSRGMLVIGLGVILLVAAAVTLLRPDKPTKPTKPTDAGGDPADSSDDRADIS